METYHVPGKIKSPLKTRFTACDFVIQAEDREHARWQVHHGVIEARLHDIHPGTVARYDLRQLRRVAA